MRAAAGRARAEGRGLSEEAQDANGQAGALVRTGTSWRARCDGACVGNQRVTVGRGAALARG